MLKISPPKTNIPLNNKRTAQNTKNEEIIGMPKISISKTIAEIISIEPNIFSVNIKIV